MFNKLLLTCFLAVAVAGCSHAPEGLTLYAIDGLVEPTNSVTDAKHFRGYRILGSVEMTDPAARLEIMKAVSDGIAEGDVPAPCFLPRHGVHVVRDGKAVDYVICYECSQLYVFSSAGKEWKTTSATHHAVLTDRLTAAGIQLAPKIDDGIPISN